MRSLARSLAASGCVVLLAACGAGSARDSAPDGGGVGPTRIVGTVTAGPTCPVQRAGSPCPDRPVSGATVQAVRGSSVVATTRTDARGAFRLDVAPGAYTVVASSVGGYRSTAQQHVSLRAGQRATVRLVLDTGIR